MAHQALDYCCRDPLELEHAAHQDRRAAQHNRETVTEKFLNFFATLVSAN